MQELLFSPIGAVKLCFGGLRKRLNLADVVVNDVIECTPYVLKVREFSVFAMHRHI